MTQEDHIHLLLSLAVFAGIAAVAYADHVVIAISLGYLYILPLALSAMVHRLRVSLSLAAFCVLLHDALGPFTEVGWMKAGRNLLTLVGFVGVVLFVSRLTAARRHLEEIVRKQRDELRNEIRMAARVQHRLLPAEPPPLPGFDIAGAMFPAKTVGGDCFDFIRLGPDQLGLVIADVSGKGVAAALLMSSVEVALRMASSESREPAMVAERVNHIVFDITEDDGYATLFFATLDTSRHSLHYTNAGHLPALLWRPAACEPEWLEAGGAVVGLVLEAQYVSDTAQVPPGSVLVLYTDGITEAEGADGEQFSKARLASVVRNNLRKSAREIIDAVHDAAQQFAGTANQQDDMTLVVLKTLAT